MLLSFKEESEILTKRQIMDRAFVQNTHIFQTLLEARYIQALPWKPPVHGEAYTPPREYVLTQVGVHYRSLQNVAENLKWG